MKKHMEDTVILDTQPILSTFAQKENFGENTHYEDKRNKTNNYNLKLNISYTVSGAPTD